MRYLLLLVPFLLSACYAPAPRYSGPGTMQDFANARYQCVQETSARQSGAYINQYGGYANSTVKPTCSAFTACLAAKGYYENPNGQFDPARAGIGVSCK